ncbi:uncharacterized protein LOC110247206 [Exaiptasia diaphana]|uniref:Uncharacterized protein n=1 Tax=Exaiptasia diaphana TaxID=2652724 RepID=A0A913XT22_EXADI|nr:uncharacterized protein LOC110247206 [Exaiptasia diaphana]KXJ24789.1 hypothetical protein AC249_AIPGENE21048 [Exaiptasia diaphana]
MAEDSKVWVENQKIVQSIHQKLKKELSQIAKAKSWSVEKTEAFEKSLNELYKDVIQESVKSNVSVNGKEWVDELNTTQTTAKPVQEPVNKERLKEVNNMWMSLEDLIRDTTSKHKTYPPKITQTMTNVLRSKVELLEKYSPVVKSDTIETSRPTCQDESDCTQRLQAAMTEQALLTKKFPSLQTKTEDLHQAMITHKEMQDSETDAVLFGKTPKPSRRSTRTPRTPDRYGSPAKTKQSAKKTSLRNNLITKTLSYSYKKK